MSDELITRAEAMTIAKSAVEQTLTPYVRFARGMAAFAKEIRVRSYVLPDTDPTKNSGMAIARAVEKMLTDSGLNLDGNVMPKREPTLATTTTHFAGVGNVTHADFSAERLFRHARSAK